MPVLLKGEAPCLLVAESQPSSSPSPSQLQQLPEVLKPVRTCNFKKSLMPGEEVIMACYSCPVTWNWTVTSLCLMDH